MSDPLPGLSGMGPGLQDFDSESPWQRASGPVGAKLPMLLRQRATSLASGNAAASSQSRGQLLSAPLRAPDAQVLLTAAMLQAAACTLL